MEPVVLALEKKYGNQVDFIVADVDKEKVLADKYQVYYIPAFVFIGKNGVVIDNNVGEVSQKKLAQQIEHLIKNYK